MPTEFPLEAPRRGPTPAAPRWLDRPAPAIDWAMAQKFGTLREYRGGKWRIDCRPYGDIYSTLGQPFKTKEEAQGVLEHIRAQIATGTPKQVAVDKWLPKTGSRYRCELWLAEWLKVMEAREQAGERSPNYLREIRRWTSPEGAFSYWTGKSIHDIRPGALDDWAALLATQGLAAKTRRNILGGLHSFCAWLKRRELIEHLPSFPEIPMDEYSPKIISTNLQAQILAAIPYDRRGAFLACRLGIRPGEVRAADLTDYREAEGVPGLLIARAQKGPNANAPIRGTKNRKAAWIPVDEELQAWIEWRLTEYKPKTLASRNVLFPNPTGRTPERRWIANALSEEWKRAALSVGIEGVTLYEGTKHSSASAWLTRGASIDVVRRLLRHSDRRSTERYAKLGDGALVGVIRPAPRLSTLSE